MIATFKWRASLRRKRDSRTRRAFSIAEALVVVAVFGLLAGIVAAIVPKLVTAPSSEQAKTDTLQSLTQAMYSIQSDVRQSDPNGIFACAASNGGTTCTAASDFVQLTDAPYLAVLTAHANGSGDVTWDAEGKPVWTGFNVYWLAADGQGGFDLEYGFGAAQVSPGADPAILNPDVSNAVNAAVAAPGPKIIAHSISSLQTMVTTATDRVSLRVAAQSNEHGRVNETSSESGAFARN